ncbi:MAG TPA: NUDIX domain-containing protein, partial [Candidatus Omnitrophota bacterium]|nr:NUDIX domain-containing protein [Candidatus Omnitrophota bacterium]
HKLGLWHMTAHINIVDKEDRILLQKRSNQTRSSRGKFQFAVSGHVNFGEVPEETALREGKEEIGIDLDARRLEKVSGMNGIRISYENDDGRNNEFTTLYKYRVTDEELDRIRENYNFNENEEFWLVPVKVFEQMYRESPELFSRSFNRILGENGYVYQNITRYLAQQDLPEDTPQNSPVSGPKDVGGIDFNDIEMDREGGRVRIEFDPAELQQMIDAGITGFSPVIINIVPLPSVLPLLGLKPQKEKDFELSKFQ